VVLAGDLEANLEFVGSATLESPVVEVAEGS